MNLIIDSSLTLDECLYYRFLTMIAKQDLKYNILIESEPEEVDKYYKILKSHGWFDFTDDFISENQEDGVRISKNLDYPNTIQTQYIRCENIPNLMGKIKSFSDL